MSIADLAASGFVRMPRAWVSLDLSPGAKVLLLHLCAAANEAGESWYKYARLGAIIGRSKAAVSGYVAELVEAGLIETERQRAANGYNAHLLIRLLGWAELTRAWGRMRRARAAAPAAADRERPAREAAGAPPPPAPAVPATERRVRPAERIYPSGTNETQSNKTPPAPVPTMKAATETEAVEWSEEDERAWARAKLGDLGLDFDRPPQDALLHRAVAVHEALRGRAGALERPALEAAARRALDAFRARRRLAADEAALPESAAILAEHGRTLGGIARAVAHLDGIWALHWRRLSAPEQLRATLSTPEARKAILSEEDRLLWRFASRALMARRELALRRRSREEIARRETAMAAAAP